MKLLIKDRGTSKTTGLIYASEATGYPIVTRSKIQSCYIEDMAKDMGCDIPEPLTVSELHTSRVLPPETNVFFDNIETIIEDANGDGEINVNIVVNTVDTSEESQYNAV